MVILLTENSALYRPEAALPRQTFCSGRSIVICCSVLSSCGSFLGADVGLETSLFRGTTRNFLIRQSFGT